MASPTTFTKNYSPEEYAALLSITTTNYERNFNDQLLQLITGSLQTTFAYAATANVGLNQTVSYPFIVIQRIDNYEEYRLRGTSSQEVSFVSLSSLKGAIETYTSNWRSSSQLLHKALVYAEMQFGNELFVSPRSLWEPEQVTPEREEQETIRADTNRALSFGELLYALDRISRPIEVEDVPLSVDPDDYPVV